MPSGTPPSSSQALILTRSASHSPPPRRPLLSLIPASISRGNEQWQPILHASNQVVLYNPQSHALSITSAPITTTNSVRSAALTRPPPGQWAALTTGDATTTTTMFRPCPYCKQNLPEGFHGYPREERSFRRSGGSVGEVDDDDSRWETVIDHTPEGEADDDNEFELVMSTDPAYHSRAFDYFRLLAVANDASSSQASGSRRPSIISPSSGAENDGLRGEGSRRRRSHSKGKARGSRSRSQSPERYRSESGAFPAEKMAQGYFGTFFREEYRLGMGANGSVFLCQHVLDGNSLGHFAVKKIAVGESHAYLYNILKEVRLLERLRHPNVITYHHAWLETYQFSPFGPKVPTLFVLMQWAEGGSLDDFIDVRLGRKLAHDFMPPFHHSELSDPLDTSVPASPISSNQGGDLAQESEDEIADTPTSTRHPENPLSDDGARRRNTPSPSSAQTTVHPSSGLRKDDPQHSRSARIRAFRAYQRAPPEEKERIRRGMEDVIGTAAANVGSWEGGGGSASGGKKEWTAVHLLSADEVKSLFRDVVEGLAFLHSKSILHLDLKPGNVLLTWDEGRLIPRAMLSDFGTSRDMIHSSLNRSGNTGTLEYTAPESLPSPQTGLLQHIDSKADMWSLGMILHKLLFFKLPYRYAADGDANGGPISHTDEGEKFAQLEREVLAYPGFKSTPALVTGFETRRLPRAFLVLLENLLHKSPGGRPSCERVLTAIQEGKFDPLVMIPGLNLTVARTWSVEGHGLSSSPPPTAAAGVDPMFEQMTGTSEKTQLLALPSPDEVGRSEEDEDREVWFRWLEALKAWLDLAHSSTEIGRRERRNLAAVAMKLVRSALLVAKVLTIGQVCPDPRTRPRSLVSAFLLALAICDTVLDHDDWKGQEGEGIRSSQEKREKEGIRLLRRTISRVGSGIWFTAVLTLFHFALTSGSKGGFHEFWSRACCVEI